MTAEHTAWVEIYGQPFAAICTCGWQTRRSKSRERIEGRCATTYGEPASKSAFSTSPATWTKRPHRQREGKR